MMTVTIVYSDGIEIEAELNGTTYITDSKPHFPEGRFSATVTGDRYKGFVYNAEPVEIPSEDGRYWFAFREITQDMRYKEQLEDTIQMLTDCLLEMSELLYS